MGFQGKTMGISYFEKERIFKLDTQNTSYVIAAADEEGFIGHVYYGRKLEGQELSYLLRLGEAPFVPSGNDRDRISFMDSFPAEYPGYGRGDYRTAALVVRTQQGHRASEVLYGSHEIYGGKRGLEGLPASFGEDGECETLVLHCHDANVDVDLFYTVFEKTDVIARHAEIYNPGEEPVWLEKVCSMSLDMDDRSFETVTLHGSWARERHIQKMKLGLGSYTVSSGRGESGHQDHPFLGLKESGAGQEQGDVYGVQLMYSGNFEMRAEVNQFDSVRWQAGINPDGFCWKLECGDRFCTPEALLIYSAQGLGGMSRNYHDFLRKHVIRGKYKDKKRPILINNWEATYFDFNTEKLLDIAQKASALGIEMLVMDDGWFGNRFDDNRALGDWFVNEEKLPGGLKRLVDGVNALGMKFGIWFEPEMVSPESQLYREHPDWAIAIPGRIPAKARNQYVLDFSRKEIVDGIWERMKSILKSANIEYVKWDMNRPLSDMGSMGLPAERQGELAHRYMLGVYELQERLVTEFPDILLENCSGGGARFDAGMLYYSPQIWCSDDTDAIERLSIQEGTALLYPLSCIGAHVSDCPNHAVGRNTPFETRGYVALAGTFGYELDVTRIPEEDYSRIPEQTQLYHKYNDLIREGDYYRLASYSENHKYDCWMVAAKDKSEALVTWIQVLGEANGHSRLIRLNGLDASARYQIEGSDCTFGGDALMYAGLPVERLWGDFAGKLIHLIRL